MTRFISKLMDSKANTSFPVVLKETVATLMNLCSPHLVT